MQITLPISPRRLAATSAAALALAAASAAPATATVVNDPDEPAVASGSDIEWAGASRRFVAGTGWLYTHSIKTRAPYTSRPCLRIKVAASTAYRVCNTKVRPGTGKATVTQTPLGAPDTISYTFNATAIGSPTRYGWYATIGIAPNADWAPDMGYSFYPAPLFPAELEIAAPPWMPTVPWSDFDPPLDEDPFDDLPECIKC